MIVEVEWQSPSSSPSSIKYHPSLFLFFERGHSGEDIYVNDLNDAFVSLINISANPNIV
jgi:hypothetical protein